MFWKEFFASEAFVPFRKVAILRRIKNGFYFRVKVKLLELFTDTDYVVLKVVLHLLGEVVVNDEKRNVIECGSGVIQPRRSGVWVLWCDRL